MAVEYVKETIPNINSKPELEVKSDKFNHLFYIRKIVGGGLFYGIQVSKGSVPAELQGKYTQMSKALEALERYELKATKSPTVERDIKNAAAVQRKRSKLVHQGADNGKG